MVQTPHASFQAAHHLLRHRTGVVIPVYLPSGIELVQGEALLRDTVAGYVSQVSDPAVVCLSVDGETHGEDVASRLAQTYGASVALSPTNRGKLQAAREGVRLLLAARSDLDYVTIVDQDGDHFANELLNFVRAAAHIAEETGYPDVMVLGRRISLHRPMGWLRGELEKLADTLLLRALQYHAVIQATPLRLEYATMLDDIPDFHSGYKLFSREVASAVFLTEPRLAGLSEGVYYRHACEAIMTVEALLARARLAVVNRSTFNVQPVSTFGLFDRAELTADMILWPCRRLEVPPAFVRQWLANYIPPLQLGTLVPEGRDELRAVYRRVINGLGGEEDAVDPFSRQPLFL